MKNIVVLMLDTFRASDVNFNSRLKTISNLARNGTVYTNAIAPGMWTATSHAALFTNRRVSSIKNVSKNFFINGSKKIDPWMVKTKFLEDGEKTLALKMHRLKYHSTLLSSNPFLTSFTNLAIGFDKTYDVWLDSNVKYNKSLVEKLSFIINGGERARARMFTASYAFTSILPPLLLDKLYLHLRQRLAEGIARADGTYRLDKGASDVNKTLQMHLTNNYNDRQNFVFINYIEGHENYPVSQSAKLKQDKWLYLSGIEELSSDVTKKLHDAYLKRLYYIDDKVKEAIGIMKQNGLLEDATVVIASDHGQSFGEHGLLYHSLPPYQELAHVPLIAVNYENGRPVGPKAEIDKPVSLVSLHKSLLNIASGKEECLNGNMRGSRYVVSEHTGICEGWDERLLRMLKPRCRSAALIYNTKNRCNAKATAIYEGDMKVMHYFGRKKDELYNLAKDPQEQDNLIDRNRATAKSMLHALT